MFQIDIEGFSGPLDLLCHLIESRQLDPTGIKVSQVLHLYAAWLAARAGVPIEQLAEFISQASVLVLEKTMAIAPPPAPVEDELPVFDEEDEDLVDLLERYRPYRLAALHLAELWRAQSGRRYRTVPDGEARYEIGNLYRMAQMWRRLLALRRALPREEFYWDDEAEGVPEAIPDEGQVEVAMERVLERLELVGQTTLRRLLEGSPGRGPLAVTLLALLELTRQRRVTLCQEEMFGDVGIGLRAPVAVD